MPLIFAVFLFTGQKRNATVVENSLFALTKSATKLTEHFILNAQKSVIALSDIPKSISPLGNTSAHRKYLKRIFVRYKIFLTVLFTDGEGKTICRYGAPAADIGKIFHSDGRRINSMISNIIDLDGSAGAGERETIAIVSEVQGGGGYLVALIKSSALEEILKKIVPYEGSYFYLMDSTGKTIFLDKSASAEKNAGEFISVKRRDSASVMKRSVTRAGIRYFEVFAEVSGFPGWRLALSAPYKRAFKNISDAKTLGVVFSLISLILAGTLAVYFSRKISEPLEELSQAADEFASGNLSYRLKLKTGDEIETLASRFNEMAQKISEYQMGQKQKIKMSARDLSNAYKEIAEKNEKLALADKYKSRFLATMSHELRTPMNAIIGFTDLLKDGIYGDISEKQKEILSKVQRNSNHLLNLINDILDLSKIEAGRIELLPEKFFLDDVILEVSRELPPPGPDVEFAANCQKGIELFHDIMRLKQVVFNLLSNAFKFTQKGKVFLECIKREKVVSIRVTDTGIGIKKEDLGKIFDSFQQADASITRQFQGTGLGLSISRKLVELMGGWIEVESEFGKGSVFTVNIPYEYQPPLNLPLEKGEK